MTKILQAHFIFRAAVNSISLTFAIVKVLQIFSQKYKISSNFLSNAIQRTSAGFAVGLNCPVSIELMVFLDTQLILQADFGIDSSRFLHPLNDF